MTKQFTINHFVMILILFLISFIGFFNYLIFHSIIEILSVCIAFMLFINTKTSQGYNNTYNKLFVLASAFGIVGIFDLLHLLSFANVGDFLVDNYNVSIQVWIGARIIECLSLLIFIHLSKGNFKRFRIVEMIYCTVAFILGVFIYFRIFPDCYIEGYGITDFTKVIQFVVISVLLLATIGLYNKREEYDYKTYRIIKYALAITIISQIAFLIIGELMEPLNILGHILKIIAYYLFFKGIIQETIIQPFIEIAYNEHKYYQLIQFLPESIIIEGQRGILLVNDSAHNILGLANGDNYYNKKICDLLTDIKGTRIVCTEQRSTEYCVNRWDGVVKYVEITSIPIEYNGEIASLIVMVDITDKKEAERLRRLQEAKEQELKDTLLFESLKDNLFDNLSHEFKTPLNVILGIAQIMELDMDNKEYIEEKNKNYIKTIKQNGYRLWRLLENLISITNINTGEYRLSLNKENIVEVVENVTIAAANYLHNCDISIIFDTEIEERFIYCDTDLIERIIINLISNGIKFSKGKRLVCVTILNRKEHITIEVKDNGIGIPQDKLHKIFQSFTRVDESFTRDNEGSGIGLSLVNSLIQLHKGTITVASDETGSIFSINIPTGLMKKNDNNYRRNIGRQVKKERFPIEFSDIYSILEKKAN